MTKMQLSRHIPVQFGPRYGHAGSFFQEFGFHSFFKLLCVIQGWPYQSFFRVISKHSKPFDFLKEQFNHIKYFCGVCVGPPKYPSHSSLENIGTSTYHLLLSCIVTFGEDPARIGPIKTECLWA